MTCTLPRFFALTLALLILFTACAQSPAAPTWQEQYDLGVRYLSEGNYQEAIIAFTAAIEIDPKQAVAYEKLADAHLALGDAESARKALEDGCAATGEAALQERLDALAAEDGGGPQSERYGFTAEVTAEGMDVEAEGLAVRVRDSRTATVTISGLSMRDSYLTNRSDSKKNMAEYHWRVEMYGGQEAYSVSTSSWAFEPGLNETLSPADMQHSLWRYDGDSWPKIGSAAMSYTGDSITWTFTVPEEYPFDFAAVDRYEVQIKDVSQNLNLSRSYQLNGEERRE